MNKPVGKQKPKPPPYPRPVPKLVIEELPPRPEDLAWDALHGGGYYEDDGSNRVDDIESEHVRTKRRKIEAVAASYLRGEQIHITSARLKGPLDKRWKNPWAKKRTVIRSTSAVASTLVEIPETAKKVSSNNEHTATTKIQARTPPPRPATSYSRHQDQKRGVEGVEQAPSPFTSRLNKNFAVKTTPKQQKQIREKQVKDWLQTDDSYAKESDILVHSSPSPAPPPRRRNLQDQKDEFARSISQSEPPRELSPQVSSVRSAISLQPKHRRSLAEAAKRAQKLSRDMQTIIDEPVAQTTDDLQAEVRKLATTRQNVNHSSVTRAEHAILRNRHEAWQVIPASAHLSPFEFRKAVAADQAPVGLNPSRPKSRHGDVPVEDLSLHDPTEGSQRIITTTTTEAEDFQPGSQRPDAESYATAPQQIQKEATNLQRGCGKPDETSTGIISEKDGEQAATDVPRAQLSTAVSELSTAEMLPSAQPRPEPVHSSNTRDDKLLSIKPITSVSDKLDSRKAISSTTETTSIQETCELQEAVPTSGAKNSSFKGADASTPLPKISTAALDTQELLANLEPLEISTIKKATGHVRHNTPPTVTKAKPERKRKKTSFVCDPMPTTYTNSIQDVMKAKVSKRLGSSPRFLFGKDDLDIEMSDEENDTERTRPKGSLGTTKPKGILRSTNATSSPTSQRKSRPGLSSAQDQDGLRVSLLPMGSGQNALEDENYDLDAAIDDLGSFLGTWDAEKEALESEH